MFEDAAFAYLQDGRDGRFLKPLLKHFRGRALRSIKPKDIRDAAKKLYPAGSAATLNRRHEQSSITRLRRAGVIPSPSASSGSINLSGSPSEPTGSSRFRRRPNGAATSASPFFAGSSSKRGRASAKPYA
jgi:hypothetical protein